MSASDVLATAQPAPEIMKTLHPAVGALLTCLALMSEPAIANVPTGPGLMRCTTVVSRLSSPQLIDRMPLLTWAQGYLSGIASVSTALDGTSDVDVPAYDDLQPRILALCRADPTADLFHVARRLRKTAMRE